MWAEYRSLFMSKKCIYLRDVPITIAKKNIHARQTMRQGCTQLMLSEVAALDLNCSSLNNWWVDHE